jgi:hypothetical protein
VQYDLTSRSIRSSRAWSIWCARSIRSSRTWSIRCTRSIRSSRTWSILRTRSHGTPGAIQPSAERISREPRLHAALGTTQPRAERADLTPDEVVNSAPRMDHQTSDEVVDPAISCATVVHTTSQEPGRRVTRSQRTNELVVLVVVPDLVLDPRSQHLRSQREMLNSPLQMRGAQ